MSYKCGACGGSFASEEELKKHGAEQHGMKPYACTACGSSFGSTEELMKHGKEQHGM